VTTVTSMNGGDFAALMEARIRHTEAAKQRVIEHRPDQPPPQWTVLCEAPMSDEPQGITILGRCGGGFRLVVEDVRSFEWISLPQREPRRARQRSGPPSRASL
jgi:hypothetical protein